MSLPTRRQAYAFLEPLRGSSAVFLLRDRGAHFALSAFLLRSLAVLRLPVAVLDTNCFYATNIQRMVRGISKQFLQQSNLLHFTDDVSDSMSQMVASESSTKVVDDLNTILHLLSFRQKKSGIHDLSNFYHILSYDARVNNTFALGVIFKTDSNRFPARTTDRTLPKISDLQITTEVHDEEMLFRCSAIKSWPSGRFRVSLYLDDRT
jgi:hypothetical protein